ncbi:hypothetical protein MAPG_04811, partial [Magnaporthiopsis poae ATCC 64411]
MQPLLPGPAANCISCLAADNCRQLFGISEAQWAESLSIPPEAPIEDWAQNGWQLARTRPKTPPDLNQNPAAALAKMSDLNVPPTKHSFMLLTPFHMPTPDGERWAIAFSAREGVLVSSAISVAMGLIFTLLWNIFIFFTVMFQNRPFRRRYAALITLWNSNDPFSAFKEMALYTWHYFSPPKEQRQSPGDHPTGKPKEDNPAPPPTAETKKTATETTSPTSKETESPETGSAQSTTPQPSGPDHTKYPFRPSSWKRDCAYGLLLTLIALIVYGGDKALGVVVPGLVVLGAVAPADPDSVYYPVPSEGDVDPAGNLRNFGLKAPAVMRALGSVEAAGPTIRPKIQMTTTTLKPWNGTEPMHNVTYSYSVSGLDFGLQRGSIINLQVNGTCVTEYGWLLEERPAADLYSLWDNKLNFSIPIDNVSIADAPKASFLMPADAGPQYVKTGNMTFAVVIWSAHRASISMGSNPWYATETRGPAPRAPYQAGFWIKRRRPVLSCWQKDTWTYGDQTVNSVFDLKRLPGIQIEQILLKVLEAALSVPLIVKLGNASGDSA